MNPSIHAANSGLLDFLSALPSTLYEGLHAYFYEYLGQEGVAVPFGGRRAEQAELDRWLAGSDASRALVVAEAGRGKSALLTRWAAHVSASGLARVAFVPVSIRFHTALASAFARLMRVRIASLCGKTLESSAPAPADEFAEIQALLREDQPDDATPLVVVLDGLDEAVGWMIGRHFTLPETLGHKVKVLVSARILSDCDENGWLERLGWSGRATRVPLPHLSAVAVREVLEGMGDPLAQLEGRVDIVAELHRLSEGDPLLIRLLIDALRATGDQAAMVAPDELAHLRSGLDGFFARWWDEQRRQWGSSAPDTEPHVRAILNCFSSALGPLSAMDLDALVGSKGTTIPRAIGRFVIGNGVERGYVFSHPRFGQFLRQQMTEGERLHFDERFVHYGIDVVARLSRGEIGPTAVPQYVLHHHVAHLDRAEAAPQHYYDLIQRGWLEAWENLDGGFGGFLRDLDRAFVLTDAEFARASTIETRGAALVRQVRYHEILVHIRQVERLVDEDLWDLLLREGIWTSAMALERAKGLRYRDQERLLLLLLPRLPDERLWEIAAMLRDNERLEGDSYDWLRFALVERFVSIERYSEAASLLEGAGCFWQRGTEAWKLCARLPKELHPPIHAKILREVLAEREPFGGYDPYGSIRGIRESILAAMVECGNFEAAAQVRASIEALPKPPENIVKPASPSTWRPEESRCDKLRRHKNLPEEERRVVIRRGLEALVEETKEREYGSNRDLWQELEVWLELANGTPGAISHEEYATALHAVLHARYRRDDEGFWMDSGVGLAQVVPVDLLAPLLRVAWEGLDLWGKSIQRELETTRDKVHQRYEIARQLKPPLSLVWAVAERLPPAERDELRRALVARALTSEFDIWRNGTRNDDHYVDSWWSFFDPADRRAMLEASLRRARRFASEYDVLTRLVDIVGTLEEPGQIHVRDEILRIARRTDHSDVIHLLGELGKKLGATQRAPVIAELCARLDRADGMSEPIPIVLALLPLVSPEEKSILARRGCAGANLEWVPALNTMLTVLPEDERYRIADEIIEAALSKGNEHWRVLLMATSSVRPSTRARSFSHEFAKLFDKPWSLLYMMLQAHGDEVTRIGKRLWEIGVMPPEPYPSKWSAPSEIAALPQALSREMLRPLARELFPFVEGKSNEQEIYASWAKRAAILGDVDFMYELFDKLGGEHKVPIFLSREMLEEAAAELAILCKGEHQWFDSSKLFAEIAASKYASFFAHWFNDDAIRSYLRVAAWGTLWPALRPDEREELLPAVERAVREAKTIGQGVFGNQLVDAVSSETLAEAWLACANKSAEAMPHGRSEACPSFLASYVTDCMAIRRLGGESALRAVAATIVEINGWFR